MSKIKVVHHSKSVSYAGTDRTAQLLAKYQVGEEFEPFIIYRVNPSDPDDCLERLDIVKEWIGEDHVIPYTWIPGERSKFSPFAPEQTNIGEVLAGINPDIIHVHRSGYNEFPQKSLFPKAKWVETNIFGDVSRDGIDHHLYVSDFIRNRAMESGGRDGDIVLNPIEQPYRDVLPGSKETCRKKLLKTHSLPSNAILLGRVGRADNFDPIALKALNELIGENSHIHYLVVNGCDRWVQTTKELGLANNVHFIDPIFDDKELSDFYMGLDIYAHARIDGESCGCNIQEAMMHRLPIITHEGHTYQAQREIVVNGGFCVPFGDYEAYAKVLGVLIDRADVRDHYGLEARREAMGSFEASCITSKVNGIYESLLSEDSNE
jgi:glycosyltransferase involved in cell wall biosynthesis